MPVIDAFVMGGPFMPVILIVALLSYVYLLERYHLLYIKLRPASERWVKTLRDCLASGDFAKAERGLFQSSTPFNEIVLKGCHVVRKAGAEDEIRAHMEEELTRNAHLISRANRYVKPLGYLILALGALGTVFGIIDKFIDVTERDLIERTMWLVRSFAEALYALVFGILLSLPLFGAAEIFKHKAQDLIADLSLKCTEIGNDLVFYVRRKPVIPPADPEIKGNA